jgi:hypothetical protein
VEKTISTFPNSYSQGVYMFYKTGYLSSLVLMCLAVFALSTGAIDAYGFIACIVYGTVSGCFFVYQEFKGE